MLKIQVQFRNYVVVFIPNNIIANEAVVVKLEIKSYFIADFIQIWHQYFRFVIHLRVILFLFFQSIT